MKVYLSGPMTGLFGLNKKQFSEYEKKFKELGFDVVNPHNLYPSEKKLPWKEYMKGDIKHLVECDMVAVLPGWDKSRGALCEVTLASQLNIDVVCADSRKPVFDKVNISFSLIKK